MPDIESVKFDIKNIKAIVGLGNPGNKYYKTRHSIGFRIVDALVFKNLSEWKVNGNIEVAQIKLENISNNIYVIKSLEFMNSSGIIIPFVLKKGIKPEEILVIHDELEKEFGSAHVRFGGSARGHNGLKSIIRIAGENFWRLRIGIGRPKNKDDVSEYVLSNFLPEEEEKIPELITKALGFMFC